jgi:hypothetical protein
MKAFAVLTFSLVIAATSVTAQKLPDKPYTEWSKDAALRIVSESPWAKTYSSTENKAGADARMGAREQRDGVYGGGSRPGSVARNLGNLPVVIRLHSAPAIRQATVRLQQLNVNYDKMSDADKRSFDENRKIFLDCAICKDYYVVTMTKYLDSSGQSVNEGIFHALKLEDVKGHVTLTNDAGEKRELVQFTPPKGAADPAVFYFKRLDANGKPLLTPESKELQFVFSNDFIDLNKRDAGLFPRMFEFSVSKMLVGGEVMF